MAWYVYNYLKNIEKRKIVVCSSSLFVNLAWLWKVGRLDKFQVSIAMHVGFFTSLISLNFLHPFLVEKLESN